MPANPYVVGQWVRGERFYGRATMIHEILHGNRNCLWVLGTRRIGKTSLLKQLELITTSSPELPYFSVFWDFQGAEEPEDLHQGFGDALVDAEERLEEQGISLGRVENPDMFKSLRLLRRELRSKNLRLLLLCDEVEELIGLHQRDPVLLRKLRRAMQSHEDTRTILASKIRLWELADERVDTSPFLEGFTPPLYIRPLDDDEARALIRQANLPSDSRPRLDEEAVETVRKHCNNHPYLIQLLCDRCLELDDLQAAIEQVAADPTVSYFFSVDFEMLTEIERSIIRIVAEDSPSDSDSIQARLRGRWQSLEGSLHRLQNLGYVRRDPDGGFVLANFFFRRWFGELPEDPPLESSSSDEGPTAHLRRIVTPWLEKLAPEQRRNLSENDSTWFSPHLGVLDERYELQARIGKGATGIVYKALDRMLRVPVAVKVLKPDYSSNEEALERLRREIVLARDIGHPNILQLYHLGEYEGKKYLTMQWMEGPSLAELISSEAPFAVDRAVRIATKIASALESAHEHRVLHRDIKPHNILMDRQDEPYITDFGLARLLGEPGMTMSGVFLGTPAYASPEQANLRPLDERSDLYAFGVVLFEMLIGRQLFTGSTAEVLQKHRNAPPPAPRDLRPDIPTQLSRIVLRCLEKEPAARFQTARELRLALEPFDQPRGS